MGLKPGSKLFLGGGLVFVCAAASMGWAHAQEDAPSLHVSRMITGSEHPLLTGSVRNATGLSRVSVRTDEMEEAQTAEVFSGGNWMASFDEPLENGVYTLHVAAEFENGQVVEEVFEGALNVDIEGPEVSADRFYTNQALPALAGKAADQAGVRRVVVTVAGREYPAALTGGGWRIQVDLPMSEGVHPATVSAVDLVGNETTETFPEAIVVDLTAPVVLITPVVTGDTTPVLSGHADDSGSGIAEVTVTIQGQQYTAELSPEGGWMLADGAIETPLEIGVYDVEAVAADRAGNTAADVTGDELRIIGEESPDAAGEDE